MLLGKRISGRYKIIEMIGGGGMSNVYLAHDMILDRDVAIKILRYDFSNEDDLHRRFQREALSATSLTHPNIVNIFDVGEDGDLHYLVMEYVPGRTLKHAIIDEAPMAPEYAVDVMKQLTSAIAHAHQNQIIHRDIKPQNILLDKDNHVKITDFGIAMALSATSFTQTNSVLGTVHYLSPEQARGGTATKKSDIYALGIVLYELLTGRLPFSGESAVSIALKHLQTETPSMREAIPSIPQSLENVVMKATAKDPRNRYQTVEEMQQDLANVLSEERAHEKAFRIFDDDATKAMPAIKDKKSYDQIAETKNLTAEPAASTQGAVLPPAAVKKKKKWPWIIAIIAVLLLVGLFIFIVFPGVFGPDQAEIPDVSDMPVDEAKDLIEEAGFALGDEKEQFSEEFEEGKVIRTTPQAGKVRDEGTEVNMYISSGKERTTLVDYEGSNIDQVMGFLASQEFKSVDTREEYSNEPAGTILSQTPNGGTEIIPDETDLVFTVSKGPQLNRVIDLKEYNEKTLNDYAKSSGFNIRIVGEEYSNDIPEGFVISQTPQAGTELKPGSSIDVTLSKGPEQKPIKTYIQTVEIPYEFEEGIEQFVQIFIEDRSHSFTEPFDEFVITEATSRQIKLEIEEGQKGAYQIRINSKVIADETIKYESL